MAGQHFSDPRVFYGITADQKYASLDDVNMFNPGKDPKYIESEYRVKEGKQGGGGGNNANQKKKKGGDDEDDEHQEQKKKVEEKSKIQTVELNVSLCCDNSVRQVKGVLDVEGIEKVDCDQINKKVWVKGSLKPEVVLKKVRKVKEDAVLVEKKKQN